MAEQDWILLGKKKCERLGEHVELFEKRVYPTGLSRTSGEQYRVTERRCSCGYQCTQMEDPCVWVDPEGDGRKYNR
ncbi:MAG: hypothetical protein GY943_05475 [Chloroflexi bacterium]|nr:hypothetical protein [Chloroflexota bacterium]